VGGQAESEAIMTRNINQTASAVIHVRFAGRSFDVPMDRLDLGIGSSDEQIKRVLAQHLEVSQARVADYVVDRHANGNLTLRPEAVFG
jgi:hypothetical protein